MAKNLILFRGNLERTIARNVEEWRRIFVEKYGDMNVVSLNWETVSEDALRGELLSPPFLAEKRLVILSGPEKLEGERASKKEDPKIAALEKLLGEIPESNFVIFRRFEDPMAESVHAKLEQVAMMKTFSLLTELDRIAYASERLTHLERAGILELVRRCGDDVRTLEGEVEKLLLVDDIDKTTIEEHVRENTEVSVFRITDAILSGNAKASIDELRKVLAQEEIRSVFAVLLAGLRGFVFYRTLRRMGIAQSEATKMLGIRDFVATKYDRVSPTLAPKLVALFDSMAEIERLSKVGGLPGEGDESLVFALESAIFALKSV